MKRMQMVRTVAGLGLAAVLVLALAGCAEEKEPVQVPQPVPVAEAPETAVLAPAPVEQTPVLPRIVQVPLEANKTVSVDLDGDGVKDTVEVVSDVADQREVEFGIAQARLQVKTQTAQVQRDILYPQSAMLLAGDFDGSGTMRLLVNSPCWEGGAGPVAIDLLEEKGGVFEAQTADFLGMPGIGYEFWAYFPEFPTYYVYTAMVDGVTQKTWPPAEAVGQAQLAGQELLAELAPAFVNLVGNEAGDGYYLALHQLLRGDPVEPPLGRCITYLRWEQGKPVVYRQEYLNDPETYCDDHVCENRAHYPAVHMGAESGVLYADQIEVPQVIRAAAREQLAAYDAYRLPGVPFLPAPLEKLTAGELARLGQWAQTQQDEALTQSIRDEEAMLAAAMGPAITESTTVDLNGDGQPLTVVFDPQEVRVANVQSYPRDTETEVAVSQVTIGAAPAARALLISRTGGGFFEWELVFGKDNHTQTIPFHGDNRFDGSGSYTLGMNTYPVSMLQLYRLGEPELVQARIAYTPVTLQPGDAYGGFWEQAVVLPGLDGQPVRFAAGEPLWVVDCRDRYLTLMNEAGAVGTALVGDWHAAIVPEPGIAHASSVGYAMSQFEYFYDNLGNAYHVSALAGTSFSS